MSRPLAPVPTDLLDLARRQGGLVTTQQSDGHGVTPTRRACLVRRGEWARVERGVFDVDAAAPEPLDLDAARRRAAWLGLLAYGPEAIAVGRCALALHGVAGLPQAIQAEAALPRGRDRSDRAGVRLREFDDGMETVLLGGRRVASPRWALAQAVPELHRANAVAVMDSAQHLGLIDRRGIERAHRLARGRRGVARTHEWWGLTDARAESPLETFARLDCYDVGVPPDALQVPIHDADGRLLGRGDLGWRLDGDRWLVGEIDGHEWHETPAALLYDRHRQNAFVGTGIADLLRFTAEDLRIPGKVGATVRRHLHQARGRTRGCASQTVE